jgi:tetratricopeptide (TPR) repeat protein
LGEYWLNAGFIQEAIDLLEQAVPMLRAAVPPQPALLSRVLISLGESYRRSGDFRKSQRASEEARRIQQMLGNERSSVYIESFIILGSSSFDQGSYSTAERHWLRAYELAVGSPDLQLERAAILNNLANIDFLHKDWRHAEVRYLEVAEIYARVLKPDDLLWANLFGNKAVFLLKIGRFSESEEQFRKATTVWQRRGNPPDPERAQLLGNYAVLLAKDHKYQEAETLCRESVSILETCCGRPHPLLGHRLSDYSFVLDKLGRHQDAASARRRSKELLRTAPSTHTVDVETLRSEH